MPGWPNKPPMAIRVPREESGWPHHLPGPCHSSYMHAPDALPIPAHQHSQFTITMLNKHGVTDPNFD